MGIRHRRGLFGGSDTAGKRKDSYPLVLEGLEDRCLLSAGYGLVNLASDVPGLARVTDPNLVNPWGISFSPTGPFWLAENGTGVSDLLDGRGSQIPLVVTVPPAAGPGGTPTGTVFNDGQGFVVSENGVAQSSQFLFASEDGTISGWAPAVDMNTAIVGVDNSALGAIYKGLALATDSAGASFLYAADFHNGKIDVFDEEFQPVVRAGAFEDATIPTGYAPFNVQNIGNLLFVTYTQQNAERYDEVNGSSHGFVDVYDTQGSLVKRFASQGTLNSPWGLAMAPADFGSFGGDLLVGNVGDGRINAYDPASGAFLGQLADNAGQPLSIPVLWTLTFGNGHMGGDANTLFFTAGPGDEQHGLFGAIQSPQGQGGDTAGPGSFDPSAPGERPDYPLPPSGGPALQPGHDDGSTTVAVLMPLRDSSLALAPTLYAVPNAGTAVEAAAPAGPFVTASYGRSASSMLVASVATFIPDDTQTVESGAQNNSVALGTFLDVDTLRSFKVDMGEGQLDTGPAVRSTVSWNSTSQETRGEGTLGQPRGENRGPNSGADLVTGTVSLSNAALADPAQGGSALSSDPEPITTSVAAAPRGPWTMLRNNLLGVLSLSLIWGCSLVRRGRPLPLAQKQTLPETAKTQVIPIA